MVSWATVVLCAAAAAPLGAIASDFALLKDPVHESVTSFALGVSDATPSMLRVADELADKFAREFRGASGAEDTQLPNNPPSDPPNNPPNTLPKHLSSELPKHLSNELPKHLAKELPKLASVGDLEARAGRGNPGRVGRGRAGFVLQGDELERGVRWNDLPDDRVLKADLDESQVDNVAALVWDLKATAPALRGVFERDAEHPAEPDVETATLPQRSHYYDLQLWHSMAPCRVVNGRADDDEVVNYRCAGMTNAQVRETILSQAAAWFAKGCINKQIDGTAGTPPLSRSEAVKFWARAGASFDHVWDLLSSVEGVGPFAKPLGEKLPYPPLVEALRTGIESGEFYVGALLHMVQDSYSAAHVMRADSADGRVQEGPVLYFQDYAAQRGDKHALSDSPSCFKKFRRYLACYGGSPRRFLDVMESYDEGRGKATAEEEKCRKERLADLNTCYQDTIGISPSSPRKGSRRRSRVSKLAGRFHRAQRIARTLRTELRAIYKFDGTIPGLGVLLNHPDRNTDRNQRRGRGEMKGGGASLYPLSAAADGGDRDGVDDGGVPHYLRRDSPGERAGELLLSQGASGTSGAAGAAGASAVKSWMAVPGALRAAQVSKTIINIFTASVAQAEGEQGKPEIIAQRCARGTRALIEFLKSGPYLLEYPDAPAGGTRPAFGGDMCPADPVRVIGHFRDYSQWDHSISGIVKNKIRTSAVAQWASRLFRADSMQHSNVDGVEVTCLSKCKNLGGGDDGPSRVGTSCFVYDHNKRQYSLQCCIDIPDPSETRDSRAGRSKYRPSVDAIAIHNAIDGVLTDSSTIVKKLVRRQPILVARIRREYERIFSKSLEADLRSEGGVGFGKFFLPQLFSTRRDAPSDPASLRRDAARLFKALDGLGTDDEAVCSILLSGSPTRNQLLATHFVGTPENNNRVSLATALRSDYSGIFEDFILGTLEPYQGSSESASKGSNLSTSSSIEGRLSAADDEQSESEAPRHRPAEGKLLSDIDRLEKDIAAAAK